MAVPIVNYFAFLTLMLAFFMAMLDTTIVNVSLPAITAYFNTDVKTISWVANGYNLAFAVLLLTASRLADQFGRRKVFAIGLFCFTVTSFLSGISPDADWLIFFRVLQGLSAAAMVPVTMPLVIELFPVKKSGAVVGAWAAIAGLAAASGPALGGIITDKLMWQWIFFINIPIGIVAMIFTFLLVKESLDTKASHKIDWLGMITITTAIFPMTYGLIQANDWGWTSPRIISLFFLSAISIALFAIIESKNREPMLPLWLMKNPFFSFSSATLFMLGMGLMNGVFFLAFFLTQVMGLTELKAGIIITVFPLTSTIFSAIAGLLSDKMGSRFFAVMGMTIVSISVYLCSGLNPHSSLMDIIWRLMLSGCGIGMAMAPVVGAMVKAVPFDKIGIASGVGNMTRTIGTVLGVAIIVTLFTHRVDKELISARTEAIKMVTANTVFKDQVKSIINDRLNKVSFASAQKLPTVSETLRLIDEKKTRSMEGVPTFLQPSIADLFEKQKKEIVSLYPKINMLFKEHVAKAFSYTFMANSFILILGIVLAFFCEPFGKQKQKPEDGAKSAISSIMAG